MEPRELQEKLLDAINDEIGEDAEAKEGLPTRLSETGEDYIEFGCKFREGEFPKVLEILTKAVRGYKDSVKFVFNRKLRDINDNGKLKVYWRVKPEIHLSNKAEKAEKDTLFATSGLSNDEREKAEQKIEEKFASVKKEDCSFYTRFLLTYQKKVIGIN